MKPFETSRKHISTLADIIYDSLVFIRMTNMNKLALVSWKERRVLNYTFGMYKL